MAKPTLTTVLAMKTRSTAKEPASRCRRAQRRELRATGWVSGAAGAVEGARGATQASHTVPALLLSPQPPKSQPQAGAPPAHTLTGASKAVCSPGRRPGWPGPASGVRLAAALMAPLKPRGRAAIRAGHPGGRGRSGPPPGPHGHQCSPSGGTRTPSGSLPHPAASPARPGACCPATSPCPRSRVPHGALAGGAWVLPSLWEWGTRAIPWGPQGISLRRDSCPASPSPASRCGADSSKSEGNDPRDPLHRHLLSRVPLSSAEPPPSTR